MLMELGLAGNRRVDAEQLVGGRAAVVDHEIRGHGRCVGRQLLGPRMGDLKLAHLVLVSLGEADGKQ
nr:hypothetical protein GCM10020185_23320 [Pseudomonas brassicacearum subsp. brassicacearum]